MDSLVRQLSQLPPGSVEARRLFLTHREVVRVSFENGVIPYRYLKIVIYMATSDDMTSVRTCDIANPQIYSNQNTPLKAESEIFHSSVIEFTTGNLEDIIEDERSVDLLRSKLPALLARTAQILRRPSDPDMLAMLRVMIFCMIHVLCGWGRASQKPDSDLVL